VEFPGIVSSVEGVFQTDNNLNKRSATFVADLLFEKYTLKTGLKAY
jgi:hypothetical protein